MFFSDFLDFAVGSALAEQVDCDDPASFFANPRFDAFGADLERFGVDVGKYWNATHSHDAFGWCDEREIWYDDFVARFESEGHESDGECVRSAGACDGPGFGFRAVFPRIAKIGQFSFQRLDHRSTDKTPTVKDLLFGL